MKTDPVGYPFTHGSLFNGIGGFQFAASFAGIENVFHCEKNKWLRTLMSERYPNSIPYGDIKTVDFRIWKNKIDLLTGGDPCQPSSKAGLRRGKTDDRYLWPEMLRAIQEIRPTWIINENVDGTISNGILDLKIDDLESENYACQAYCIPSSSVGALHLRQRIWIVAFNSDSKCNTRMSDNVQSPKYKEILQERNKIQHSWEPVTLWPINTNTNGQRCRKQHMSNKSDVWQEKLSRNFGFGSTPYGHIPRDIIKSSIIRMLNGLPKGMDFAFRYRRIKAIGNSIVPQLAYEIIKSIKTLEDARRNNN